MQSFSTLVSCWAKGQGFKSQLPDSLVSRLSGGQADDKQDDRQALASRHRGAPSHWRQSGDTEGVSDNDTAQAKAQMKDAWDHS